MHGTISSPSQGQRFLDRTTFASTRIDAAPVFKTAVPPSGHTFNPSRLLHRGPVHLRSLRKRFPRLDIRRDFLICRGLRRQQINYFLSQLLRQAHHAVEVTDQVVARIDHGVLLFALEPHGPVDLPSSSHVNERPTTPSGQRIQLEKSLRRRLSRENLTRAFKEMGIYLANADDFVRRRNTRATSKDLDRSVSVCRWKLK